MKISRVHIYIYISFNPGAVNLYSYIFNFLHFTTTTNDTMIHVHTC